MHDVAAGSAGSSSASVETSVVEKSGLFSSWDRRLHELLEYQRVHGDVCVPRGWPENPKLANWVGNQRRLLRLNLIREDRRRRLSDLGISWDGAEELRRAQQEQWDRMWGALRAFKRAHGHLNVPPRWRVDPALGPWIANQRFLQKTGSLTEARARKLDELGFEWQNRNSHDGDLPLGEGSSEPSPLETRSQLWDRLFAKLSDYRRRFGNCAVPARWEGDLELAQWVTNQRARRKRGELIRERIERLDMLGFEWSGVARKQTAQDRRWDFMLAALGEFAASQGHSSVPLDWPEPPRLGAWVFRQRYLYQKGKLEGGRVRRLEALGFVWNPRRSGDHGKAGVWQRMMDALLSFRVAHGHVQVPGGPLRNWLDRQRRQKRRGQLPTERALRLEQAGISWNLLDQKWEIRFAELLEWRRANGHCRVPMGSEEYRQLSRWISAQRTAKRKRRLHRARIARLSEIGFVWSAAPVTAVPMGPLRRTRA